MYKKNKKNMTPFHGLASTDSRPPKSILKPPSGFEPRSPELGIQCPNHQAIAL